MRAKADQALPEPLRAAWFPALLVQTVLRPQTDGTSHQRLGCEAQRTHSRRCARLKSRQNVLLDAIRTGKTPRDFASTRLGWGRLAFQLAIVSRGPERLASHRRGSHKALFRSC